MKIPYHNKLLSSFVCPSLRLRFPCLPSFQKTQRATTFPFRQSVPTPAFASPSVCNITNISTFPLLESPHRDNFLTSSPPVTQHTHIYPQRPKLTSIYSSSWHVIISPARHPYNPGAVGQGGTGRVRAVGDGKRRPAVLRHPGLHHRERRQRQSTGVPGASVPCHCPRPQQDEEAGGPLQGECPPGAKFFHFLSSQTISPPSRKIKRSRSVVHITKGRL